MKLIAIAAVAQNRTIGDQGSLPWKIPEDFRFFKEATKNHIMILGRKTLESLPGFLPGRFHIILTRTPDYQPPFQSPNDDPCWITVTDPEDAIAAAESMLASEPEWGDTVFNVGGAEVYRLLLEHTDELWLTEIHEAFEGDAVFPKWSDDDFKEVERRRASTSGTNGLPEFDFVKYCRN